MIPRIRIATLPTAVQPLPRLSAILGGPQLWIKRDDLTGLAFGGNKTRKLEFVLAEAQAVGARTLVTVGAAQSNHCRQTAALAARYGLDCILVLSGEEIGETTGNLLLDHLFGARIVWCHRNERDQVFQNTFQQALEEGRRPFRIPLGASNGLGAVAYAYAMEELLQQEFLPEWIILASSSGGTQAGLVAGAWKWGYAGKILGISIDEPQTELQHTVADLASEAADRIGNPYKFQPDQILVNSDYLGAGYGVMGEPEREAIRMFARQEGILLDPVYTGRAAAGLVDLIRKGFFRPGEKVLYWHTGGTPALFAREYSNQL